MKVRKKTTIFGLIVLTLISMMLAVNIGNPVILQSFSSIEDERVVYVVTDNDGGCFLSTSAEYKSVNDLDMTETARYYYDTLDWGVDEIDAEKVWGGEEGDTDITSGSSYYTGAGVKLCVIDSGIDSDHDDLASNYQGGWDFYDNDSDPSDTFGHGTACAGIIAAEDNDLGIIGVAPEVDLYVARNGATYPSITITDNAIDWAVENGIQIISMSLGDYDDAGEYTGYHTEPTQFDTDGDGYGDGYEIDPNLPYDPSNPNDPNSITSVGGGGGGGFF